jgi:hypothetical protein
MAKGIKLLLRRRWPGASHARRMRCGGSYGIGLRVRLQHLAEITANLEGAISRTGEWVKNSFERLSVAVAFSGTRPGNLGTCRPRHAPALDRGARPGGGRAELAARTAAPLDGSLGLELCRSATIATRGRRSARTYGSETTP